MAREVKVQSRGWSPSGKAPWAATKVEALISLPAHLSVWIVSRSTTQTGSTMAGSTGMTSFWENLSIWKMIIALWIFFWSKMASCITWKSKTPLMISSNLLWNQMSSPHLQIHYLPLATSTLSIWVIRTKICLAWSPSANFTTYSRLTTMTRMHIRASSSLCSVPLTETKPLAWTSLCTSFCPS